MPDAYTLLPNGVPTFPASQEVASLDGGRFVIRKIFGVFIDGYAVYKRLPEAYAPHLAGSALPRYARLVPTRLALRTTLFLDFAEAIDYVSELLGADHADAQ